ncbi:MAG TPA: DUF4861 family protein [Pedobacter sp.]
MLTDFKISFHLKSTFVILLTAFLIRSASYGQSKKYCTVSVINTSALNINEKVIEVRWSQILKAYSGIDTSLLIVIDAGSKKQVPYQLEKKGTSEIQNLLLQVSVHSKNKSEFIIKAGKRLPFNSKTYARYVPERYEDFAWENDKIAFRMYGKALESTTGNATGIDVWTKRTPNLVLNKWYKSGDYHKDNGEGLDFYHVGMTLGAGGIAPYFDGQIINSKNYVKYEVFDNGPLRSSFKLFYSPWMVNGQEVNYTKLVQLDAGSQLNKFEVQFVSRASDSLTIAAGIHTNNGLDVKFINEQKKILAYWEPVNKDNGQIGVGCVFISPVKSFIEDEGHILNIETIKVSIPYTYYAGACWNRAGRYLNSSQWFNYLEEFSKALEVLKVEIK